MLASNLLSAILDSLMLTIRFPSHSETTGYEPQAFQKVPGVVLAVNLVDVANIADIEHGEWHDMVLNQIRRES